MYSFSHKHVSPIFTAQVPVIPELQLENRTIRGRQINAAHDLVSGCYLAKLLPCRLLLIVIKGKTDFFLWHSRKSTLIRYEHWYPDRYTIILKTFISGPRPNPSQTSNAACAVMLVSIPPLFSRLQFWPQGMSLCSGLVPRCPTPHIRWERRRR